MEYSIRNVFDEETGEAYDAHVVLIGQKGFSSGNNFIPVTKYFGALSVRRRLRFLQITDEFFSGIFLIRPIVL